MEIPKFWQEIILVANCAICAAALWSRSTGMVPSTVNTEALEYVLRDPKFWKWWNPGDSIHLDYGGIWNYAVIKNWRI